MAAASQEVDEGSSRDGMPPSIGATTVSLETTGTSSPSESGALRGGQVDSSIPQHTDGPAGMGRSEDETGQQEVKGNREGSIVRESAPGEVLILPVIGVTERRPLSNSRTHLCQMSAENVCGICWFMSCIPLHDDHSSKQ